MGVVGHLNYSKALGRTLFSSILKKVNRIRMLLFILSLISLPLIQCVSYDTEFDQPFSFECTQGEYIKTIESEHDNGKEDRRFKFGCIPLKTFFGDAATIGKCEWSGYANDFDKVMAFTCPNNMILGGVSSYHDNGKEDRRYKFQCCAPENMVAHTCSLTDWVNTFDNNMNYRVPDGFAIHGVDSIHDNGKEDRQFKFNICKLGRVSDGVVIG